MSLLIDKDIKFDRYGDISFLGNDIDVLIYNQDILYQNIVDRLITNFNDYDLLPGFGADFSGSIGKRVDSELESTIEDKVINALTSDNFLDQQELSIIVFKEYDKIYLRITVIGVTNSISIADQFTVDAIYNTSSGMLYATN